MVAGAGVLAKRNMRDGRGDRRGAQRFGSIIAILLWLLWAFQMHPAETTGLLGALLLTIVTTAFYASLFWAMYLALEPFVRRHWPQTLVSWTTILSGRLRDPIVGRDVLFGVLLGVIVAIMIRAVDLWQGGTVWVAPALLGGARQIGGEVLTQIYGAIRTALFVFFLLFLLRVVLRNALFAAIALVLFFSATSVLVGDNPLVDALTTVAYFSLLALAVLRWGLTTLTVGLFVTNLLLAVARPADLSAWYGPQMLLVGAIPTVLAAWAFYTARAGRLWSNALLD
jgi:hypothetical protein